MCIRDRFLVETLTVILVALVLMRLPASLLREKARPSLRFTAGPIAITGGALLTVLMLAITSVPLDRSITEYYERTAYPEAHGRNIVNVILVDFRGLDTLGEITVLTVAATGVFALLRRAGGRREPEDEFGAPRGIDGPDDEPDPAAPDGTPG